MCVCSAGDFLAIGKCLLSITCQITVLGAYNKHLYRIQLLLFSFYIFSLNEEEEEEKKKNGATKGFENNLLLFLSC